MTTRVTVDTHAGWPVRVTAIDQTFGEGPGTKETVLLEVAPGTSCDFHITSTRKLLIEELAFPASKTE